MAEETEELKTSVSDEYKCPECGAPMHFDPATSSLKCDYCEKVIPLGEQSSNEEFDFDKAQDNENKSWAEESHIIRCQSCGAENVVSRKDMSITCPFCGSTQVVESQEVPGMKPNRVVPFKITNKDALESYQKWLKKKLFAPGKVKKDVPNLDIRGVYIPSWTYDTNTFSSYKGRLGKRYTRTVGTGKNRHTETYIRYFTIRGVKNIDFDDVLVQSGKKVDQREVKCMEPFSTNDSSTYDERFLVGFSAEHYSKTVKECWPEAQKEINDVIRRRILADYNYDVVDYLNVNTKYERVKYKYVLLPIWICNYEFNKKKYRFLANGETGKLTGKYPVSPVKVSICVVIGLILLGLIILLFALGDSDTGALALNLLKF